MTDDRPMRSEEEEHWRAEARSELLRLRADGASEGERWNRLAVLIAVAIGGDADQLTPDEVADIAAEVDRRRRIELGVFAPDMDLPIGWRGAAVADVDASLSAGGKR